MVGETKKCPKCGESKPLGEFGKRNRRGGTVRARCKKCHRDDCRQHYQRNRDKLLSQQREYAMGHREQHRKVSRRYYANHRERVLAAGKKSNAKHKDAIAARARRYRQENIAWLRLRGRCQAAVHKAKVSGELVPKPCGVCGTRENIHAHHEDYSRPLDVKWLCARCHKRRHKELASQDAA